MKFSILMLALFSMYSELYTQSNADAGSPYSSSQTRFIVNLGGNWEKSYDGVEWTSSYVPASEGFSDKIIYRRVIKIDPNMIDRYTWQLYFMGVEDQLEIYMNEEFVGRYFAGMTPFDVRIPRRMLSGESNSLKLIVTPATHTAQQIKNQSLYPKRVFSGVIRDIFLIGLPHIWISDLRFNTRYTGSSYNLNVSVNVSSADIQKAMQRAANDTAISPRSSRKNISIEAVLKNNDGTVTISQPVSKQLTIERERTEFINFQINASNVISWSPESPQLYKLYVKVSSGNDLFDEIVQNVGFKSISIADREGRKSFILNGKVLEIKAVSYIEDSYGSGQTINRKKMEQDVELMKTLGANSVRFKFTSPHPYFAYLCDKYGLLMLIELPIYEVPASLLQTDEIKVRMNNTSKRYLSAYDNHPSMFAWGIGDGVNETGEDYAAFSKAISAVIKESSKNLVYKIVMTGTNEIFTDGFDFIGIRIERAKYTFNEIKREVTRLKNRYGNNKPILLNFGLQVQTDNHNGYSDPLSLESQAHYILNLYYISEDIGSAGNIINTFNDYLTNTPLLTINNQDLYLSSSGLVSRKREQRLSFSTLQALFNNEKKPLLNAGSYTEKTPIAYIVVGISLGIVLVLMINRFRRFREYLFRSVLRPYNFYADIRDQRIMSSVQTVILGIVIAATLGIYLGSLFYFYRTNVLAQYTFMLFIRGNMLQELFYKLVWIPEAFMLLITFAIFIKALIFSLLLRLFSLFIRNKVYLSDTFTIVIWSGVPILILLPFAIILTRLLVYSPSLNLFVIILLAGILLWVLLRMFKATIVVFDIPRLKVYTIGFAFILVIVAIITTIYQFQYLIFPYLGYFFEVLVEY